MSAFPFLLLSITLSATPPVLPVAPAIVVLARVDSFAGVYQGKTDDGAASLTLQQDASGAVTGTLVQSGETLNLKGSLENGRVTGTCAMNGTELPLRFELKRQGNTLRFGMIFNGNEADPDTVISFTRTGGPKEPATTAEPRAPKAAAGSKPVGKAERDTRGMKTYTHPLGLSFRYPVSWKMQEANGMVLLTPPDVAKDKNGKQAEVYYLRATAANQAVVDLSTPQLAAIFDKDVTSGSPFLRRTSAPRPVRSGGGAEGVLYSYSGTGPTGLPIQANLYATVQNGFLILCIAQGKKDRVVERDSVVRALFGSITAADSSGEIDARLVGSWQGGASEGGLTATQHGRITAQSSSTSNTKYVLGQDGSLTQITSEYTIAVSGTFGIDGNSETRKKGRWSAAGGNLVIRWEDGTAETHRYTVDASGRVLLDGGALVFTRTP